MRETIFIGGPWDGRRQPMLDNSPEAYCPDIYAPVYDENGKVARYTYRETKFDCFGTLYTLYIGEGIPDYCIMQTLISGYQSVASKL